MRCMCSGSCLKRFLKADMRAEPLEEREGTLESFQVFKEVFELLPEQVLNNLHNTLHTHVKNPKPQALKFFSLCFLRCLGAQ